MLGVDNQLDGDQPGGLTCRPIAGLNRTRIFQVRRFVTVI